MIESIDEGMFYTKQLKKTKTVLSGGAMTFPGWIVNSLLLEIEKIEKQLSDCPVEWKISRSEYFMDFMGRNKNENK